MTTAPPYITRIEDATCTGWVKLGDVWISREPLRDASTGLYARFDWQDATSVCTKLGGRLIRADEVVALHATAARGEALEPAPLTLPDAELCEAAGVVFNWGTNGNALESFLTANMGGLEWAEYHDGLVSDRLDALRAERLGNGMSDGASLPLANIGKLWVGGIVVAGKLFEPPSGRAWLCGWWQGARFIQPVPTPGSRGPHGAKDEHDYGTLTVAVSETDPTIEAP